MIDYNKALYRRDNKGNPTVWYGEIVGSKSVKIHYGILGKTISTEIGNTHRKSEDELQSRINIKRKSGYLLLSEVKDDTILPVEETSIIDYLKLYLPYDRSNANGALLPMLAKLYDNKDNKLFEKTVGWLAQPKINGLRCIIGAVPNEGDIFKPVKLTFQSREGIYWDSLYRLEFYLLSVLPNELIHLMVNENYLLDGELYIPEQTVNNINSYVKNPNMSANKDIQFWCYDLAIPNMSQDKRYHVLEKHLSPFLWDIETIEQHHKVDERLVYIQSYYCPTGGSATALRNKFIDAGFEGVILRNPLAEYQFGKRNLSMLKYKATTDGIFTIVAIKSEGIKRPDIPLLTLKNDINDFTFDVHISGSFEYQKSILVNKDNFIYRRVFVSYGERSGVTQVPFHVKEVYLIEDPAEGKI